MMARRVRSRYWPSDLAANSFVQLGTSSAEVFVGQSDDGDKRLVISAFNNHSSAVQVTIEWGGSGAGSINVCELPRYSKQEFVMELPIVPGLEVGALCSVANVCNLHLEVVQG